MTAHAVALAALQAVPEAGWWLWAVFASLVTFFVVWAAWLPRRRDRERRRAAVNTEVARGRPTTVAYIRNATRRVARY